MYDPPHLKVTSRLSCGGAQGGQGGGFQNSGALTVRNSTITGNKPKFAGGILQYTGSVTIEWSTIAFNTANQPGGALVINSGPVTALWIDHREELLDPNHFKRTQPGERHQLRFHPDN